MKAVILAGGLGSRLSEETVLKPKPMVEDRRQADALAHHEHLCRARRAGVHHRARLSRRGRQGVLPELLRDQQRHHRRSGATARRRSIRDGSRRWTVHLVDTGLHTQTGGRVRRIEPWLGRRRDVHADLRRRPRRRGRRRAARLSRGARQAGDRHDRAAAGALRRHRVRRRAGQRVHREAAGRRRLDQRRLLRARSQGAATTSTATTRCGSASRWSGWPPTAS